MSLVSSLVQRFTGGGRSSVGGIGGVGGAGGTATSGGAGGKDAAIGRGVRSLFSRFRRR